MTAVRLSEVITFKKGKKPKHLAVADQVGALPYILIENFEKRKTTFTSDSSCPIAQPTDTLLVCDGARTGLACSGLHGYIGSTLASLSPDQAKLEPSYLFYFVKSHYELLNSRTKGAAIPHIDRDLLLGLEIPLPPLFEQRRIADILKRADGIRRLRKQAIQTARELIPALFVDMFGDPATNPKGWPVFPLGELLVDVNYGCSTKAAAVVSTGIPMLRMGNVMTDGRLDLSNIKYVALSEDEMRKYSLEKDDILFNRTNSKDLVGKTGLWDGRFKAVAASYFIRLRVDREQLSPTYLWVFMNTRFMKRRLFESARGAIGQANINAKELKSFTIPLPPLTLQQEYEQRLTQLAAISVQQSSAEEISETSFKSLLHRAFRGEL